MALPERSDDERLIACAALADLAVERVDRMQGGLLRLLSPAAWEAFGRWQLSDPGPGPEGRDPLDPTVMRFTPPRR